MPRNVDTVTPWVDPAFADGVFREPRPETKLEAICRVGDHKEVVPLLERRGGRSAGLMFGLLCKHGHADLARIAVGLRPTRCRYANGIYSAAIRGHRAVIAMILQIDVKFAVEGLIGACAGGDGALAEEMISLGGITGETLIRAPDRWSGLHPTVARDADGVLGCAAHAAARAGHRTLALDMARRDGTRPPKRNGLEWVLGGACAGGRARLAVEMLDQGVRITNSMLMRAFEGGHRDILALLISRKLRMKLSPRGLACVLSSTRITAAPLIVRMSPGSADTVVERLLRMGEGRLAFEAASYSKNVNSTLSSLFRPGAALNTAPGARRDNVDYLRKSLRMWKREIAIMLIRRGARPDLSRYELLGPDELERLIKAGVKSLGKFEVPAGAVRKVLADRRAALLDATPLAEALVDLVICYW